MPENGLQLLREGVEFEDIGAAGFRIDRYGRIYRYKGITNQSQLFRDDHIWAEHVLVFTLVIYLFFFSLKLDKVIADLRKWARTLPTHTR